MLLLLLSSVIVAIFGSARFRLSISITRRRNTSGLQGQFVCLILSLLLLLPILLLLQVSQPLTLRGLLLFLQFLGDPLILLSFRLCLPLLLCPPLSLFLLFLQGLNLQQTRQLILP